MEKFIRGGRGSKKRGNFRPEEGKRVHGGYGKGNERDLRPAVMHRATCSSCGKSCEVPFRPFGDKPVYCRDCFAGRAAMGGDRSNRVDPRSSTSNIPSRAIQGVRLPRDGGDGELKKQLEEVNVKLERLISSVQVLSRVLTSAQDGTQGTPQGVFHETFKNDTQVKKEPKIIKKSSKNN